MSQEEDLPVLKKGTFYNVRDSEDFFVMEDRTKRGLGVKERSLDEKLQVEADKGMIHDMDGIGHRVAIRWFFPKGRYDLDDVLVHAEDMERRYRELRELTCPDDDDG